MMEGMKASMRLSIQVALSCCMMTIKRKTLTGAGTIRQASLINQHSTRLMRTQRKTMRITVTGTPPRGEARGGRSSPRMA
jgi:hypothetical protein